jgi:hypothetical protein
MKFRNTGLLLAAVAASYMGLPSQAHAFTIDEGIEGQWYESGIDGRRGWGFTYIPTEPEQGELFVTGYVYDAGGNPYWVAGNSTVFDGQFSVDINLLYLEGGAFGPEAGNPVVADDAFGTLNVEFHTCNEATFSFAGIEGVSDFEAEFSHLKTIFGGNSADNCVYQKAFSGCPAGTSAGIVERSCVLEGTYTSDLTLTNDTTWVLSGGVFIGEKSDIGDAVPADGPVLTIEPGTRIVGSGGTGNALYIQRGSKIIAEGLPHAPIVMTGSTYASEGATAGQWGGLVINGAAPLNTCTEGVCEAVGEGDSGAYGGDDPLDDSGVLRYLRVQFAGEKINDEDELNGIAFQGVGAGTVVDYVQVHRNADDGIEFFGGTVSAKHLVLTDIEDDSVDWTQGWQGNLQYVLVDQGSIDENDRGMELDNLEQNNDALPRSGGVMANFTLLGAPSELGINPRRGTAGRFSNFLVVGFDRCLDIDSSATFAVADAGELTFENTVLDCTTNIVENDEDTPDPWSTIAWFNGQSGNAQADVTLDGAYLPVGSPYLSGYALDPEVYGEFFDDVDYVGAFASKESAWIMGWTEFLGY